MGAFCLGPVTARGHNRGVPLAAGDRVGPYEIVAPLGAGGMGEVYRARDTRLRRDVAIKMLPRAVASDPERVKRLEREAQLLASVNHRGIATIHGLEDSPHGLALIMELVEGSTLAAVVERARAAGGLPFETALPLARQIADALEAAHERGVIHRDLKPANVMCGADGVVKVLDFGLAKALDPPSSPAAAEAAQAATVTGRYTEAGTILGTAAYMAPEQARGRAVDARADVWAFGVVLYEMLTGRRAFDGRDPTEVIAHVITKEPDWSRLPASTPEAIRRLLRRSLEKDPERRLRHIGDARLELDEAGQPQPEAVPAVQTAGGRRAGLAIAAVLALAATVAAFALGWWLRTPAAIPPPEWIGERLGGSRVAMTPIISPDRQTLLFMPIVDGQTQVAAMKPESGHWTVLTKERKHGLVNQMDFSRDGSRIFFDRFLDVPNGVYSVSVFGGDERLILENAMTPRVLPDGSMLVVRINAERIPQLHRFRPDSGRIDPLPALVTSLAQLSVPVVDVFPDGREVVYLGRPADSPTGTVHHLYVLDLSSNTNRRIAPDVTLTYSSFTFPLTISGDGQSVLFIAPTGNTHPIVSVPRDGSAGVRTVLPLIHRPVGMSAASDGSLFIDQLDQPAELFRYDPASRTLERTAMTGGLTLEGASALPLAGGRTLMATRTLGRDRLVVMAAGRDPVPFVDTEEETSAPIATLGPASVVMFAGTRPRRQMAIATAADGRIVNRFQHVDGNEVITAIAGSPDGKTVFYVAGGNLWVVGGVSEQPRRVGPGDGVAVAHDGRSLIVMLTEANGIRLVRHDLQSGSQETIPLGGLRLSPWPLAANAVARDGRLAIRVISPESWFWPAAILDPRTGRSELLPEAASADMLMPGWDPEGRIVTIATFTRSALWRFRPAAK